MVSIMKKVNKFYSQDTSKWVTKSRLRPGVEFSAVPSKFVGYFCYDPDADPSGMVAKAKAAYEASFAVVEGLRTKRNDLEASKQYTPLGLQEQIGDAALKEALPALKRSRVEIEKLQAGISERRSKVTLAKPDPADTIGEMQRAEMRKRIAEMPGEARIKFVNEHRGDPAVVQAIVHAPAVLSGLADVVHNNIVAEQLQRERGEEIEELDGLAEVLNLAADVTGKARAELQSVIGCTREVFDEIAKVAEANGGRAPMRRELRVVGGQEVEIPRVYDIERKVWRDATADEIREFAA
jgi:hypothetical protein